MAKKIKLKYQQIPRNRLGNESLWISIGDIVGDWCKVQERFNDPNNSYYKLENKIMRRAVLRPGKWTLTFDGNDFFFEGSRELIREFSDSGIDIEIIEK